MHHIVVAATLAVAAAVYPGYFEGSIYPYLLGINHHRKSAARTAPEPARLWALLDPPASLGSLSYVDIQSNRIVRRSLLQMPASDLEADYNEIQNGPLEADYGEAVEDAVFRDAETTESVAATEESTEVPATEVPTTEDPITEEVPTETPSQTEETPEECGGEFVLGTEPIEKAFPSFSILSPGFDENEDTPDNLDCEWTFKVDPSLCTIGGWAYSFQPGSYIFQSESCEQDFVKISKKKDSKVKIQRYCGHLADEAHMLSGAQQWNPTFEPEEITIKLKTGEHLSNTGGQRTRFNMSIRTDCARWS